MSNPRPELIIFDLDDTLIDRAKAFRGWAQSVADEFELNNQAIEWMCFADSSGNADRALLMKAIALRFDLPEQEVFNPEAYYERMRNQIEAHRGIRDLLSKIHQAGIKLAVATNGNDFQLEKLKKSGLYDLFDHVVFSDQVPRPKPHPDIFEEILARLGSDAKDDTVWMVGDGPVPDMLGAHLAGISTAWCSNGRQWGDPATWIYRGIEFPVPSFKPDICRTNALEATHALLVHTGTTLAN